MYSCLYTVMTFLVIVFPKHFLPFFFFAFFFGKDIKKNWLKCFWATGCHYIYFLLLLYLHQIIISNTFFDFLNFLIADQNYYSACNDIYNKTNKNENVNGKLISYIIHMLHSMPCWVGWVKAENWVNNFHFFFYLGFKIYMKIGKCNQINW